MALESIEIITKSENGNLTRNRSLIEKAVKYYDGNTFKIVFKPIKKDSSDPQRKYYWPVIVAIFKIAILDTWGEIWTAEKVNEFLKQQFAFKEKVNTNTGEILRIPVSPTHDMSTMEREIYHLQCRNLAQEWFNVIIPEPNQEIQLEL